MPLSERGSLTKEFPLEHYTDLLRRIQPGTTISALRTLAGAHRRSAIPALLAKRFLLLDGDRIIFDRLLAEIQTATTPTPRAFKTMFFVWCWKDDRVRRYITEQVADVTGKWQGRHLLDLTRSKFFQEFLGAGPSRKARSNFEEFLARTGILDREEESVHMELDDGWLRVAVETVAQHESGVSRAALIANPADFLVSRSLNGLANATAAELHTYFAGEPYIADPAPTGDSQSQSARATVARRWQERSLRPRRVATVALTNDAAHERADFSHYQLEQLLAQAIQRAGFTAQCTSAIDMFAVSQGTLLVEIKSCTELNQHSQVRKGIVQLLEYQHRNRGWLEAPIHCALLLEMPLVPDNAWMSAFARELGIQLAWKSDAGLRCVIDHAEFQRVFVSPSD